MADENSESVEGESPSMGELTAADLWEAYLLSTRNHYWEERKRAVGAEYDSNKAKWDSLFTQDWVSLSERLQAGIGVADTVKAQLGEDFFIRNFELEEELNKMISTEFEEVEIDGCTLRIYYYEDFIILSNQGIFRDTEFLIDRGRKWTRKIVEELTTYGYHNAGFHDIEEMRYLRFKVVD